MNNYCKHCDATEREMIDLRDRLKWQQTCAKLDQDHVNSICRKLGRIEGLIKVISSELYLVGAYRHHPAAAPAAESALPTGAP